MLARYTAEDAELNDSNSQAGEPALAQVAHMRAKLIPASRITDEWLRSRANVAGRSERTGASAVQRADGGRGLGAGAGRNDANADGI